MTTHRMRGAVAAATALAVLGLSACGSDSDSGAADSSDGGTEASSSGTATGSPITVSVVTALDVPAGSFPGLVSGAKAAARSINAAGGVNNHPIVVESCNGKLDPNQEVTCAKDAASSGAVAVVGSIFAANPDGAQQALQDGGIASFGGAIVAPTQLSSPIAFPLDSGPFIPAACLEIAKSGLASSLATVTSDIGSIKAGEAFVADAAKSLDIPIAEQVVLPPTAPDVTSQVQQVLNSDADGIVMFAAPSQATQVLQATAQLGQQPTFCTSDGLLTAGPLTQLGPAAANVYIASSLPPLSAADTNPAVAEFVSDMKAEADSGNDDAIVDPATYGAFTMRAWAAVKGFAQVAGSISGDVDKTSFLTAVKTATDVTTGVFPPVDFTTPVGGQAFPSLYNAKLDLLKWDVDAKAFVSTDLTFDATTIIGG